MDELREKYLQGKLSAAEQKAFEEGLSAHEKEELAAELGIRAGLENGFRNELRNKVAGFEDRKRTVRRINPAYISIAASIFLVSSLVLYFTRDQTPLFDQYYEVYPNYEVTAVRGEDDLSSREQAYAAYDAGDFSTAIKAFSQLDSLVSADYFFRGICYIQVTEYDKALADLDMVISIKDKDYETASIWYTALIHLKLENDDKAVPLLRELSNGASEFAITSKELLAQI
jgi:tetratricopeptide (TPR) repeat protein